MHTNSKDRTVLIKKRLKELNKENAFNYEIKIGININSGEALVGNIDLIKDLITQL